MMDRLAAAYEAPEFQRKLSQAWYAELTERAKAKVRSDICLTVQNRVLPQFGFSEGRLGVSESVAAFAPHADDPEVAKKNLEVQWLTNPVPQHSLASRALASTHPQTPPEPTLQKSQLPSPQSETPAPPGQVTQAHSSRDGVAYHYDGGSLGQRY